MHRLGLERDCLEPSAVLSTPRGCFLLEERSRKRATNQTLNHLLQHGIVPICLPPWTPTLGGELRHLVAFYLLAGSAPLSPTPAWK